MRLGASGGIKFDNARNASDEAVVITGASRGIGEEVAYEFARRGASMVLTYREDLQSAERVAQQCQEFGARNVWLTQLDLFDDASIRSAAAYIVTHLGHIDVLVNNAGTMKSGRLQAMHFEDVAIVLRTNLEGTVKFTALCLPNIRRSVITVCSTLGLRGKKNLSAYSASKFGLRGFTQSLADEHRDLHFFAVSPSLTATRMGNFKGMSPKLIAHITVNAAFGLYRAASGSDIIVRDYMYGERLIPVVHFIRFFRRIAYRVLARLRIRR